MKTTSGNFIQCLASALRAFLFEFVAVETAIQSSPLVTPASNDSCDFLLIQSKIGPTFDQNRIVDDNQNCRQVQMSKVRIGTHEAVVDRNRWWNPPPKHRWYFQTSNLEFDTSTYKSDLVSRLPQRPSNAGAYVCIFLGICGVLFALMVGSSGSGAIGPAFVIGIIALLFVAGGIRAKKSPDQLETAQATWDRRWMCARCGNQWKAD